MSTSFQRSISLLTMSLLAIFVLTFSSCDPEEEVLAPTTDPGIQLNLRASFEGEPLVLFEPYENVLGQEMQLEAVKFYLSEIRLLSVSGEEVALSDVEIFDLNNGRLSNTLDAPAGEYSAILFNVGVPPSLNGTDNPDFETFIYQDGHPLASNNGMYWAWQTGYRFFIYDGRLDTLGASPTDIPSAFSIHMGTDTTLLALSFETDFTISENEVQTANIDLDLARCIYNETDTLDLSDPFEGSYHGGSNIDIALRFKALLRDAIDVQID